MVVMGYFCGVGVSVFVDCLPGEGSMVRCQREGWEVSQLELCISPPRKWLQTVVGRITSPLSLLLFLILEFWLSFIFFSYLSVIPPQV